MKRALEIVVKLLLSIVLAWLLWGGVLNGSALIAESLGEGSLVGHMFGEATVWLGPLGFGLPFFLTAAAVVYIGTSAIVERFRAARRARQTRD